MTRLLRNVAKAALKPPRGYDLYTDIRKLIDPKIIFDVGANIGQSTEAYLAYFDPFVVHSFEPAEATFALLTRRFAGNTKVRLHRNAFGSHAGSLRMNTREGPSEMFAVSPNGNEEVTVLTLDQLDERRIDFLKIDTEGYDLEVLRGADRMLREKRIAALQVEAGMNPRNDRHVPLEMLKSFLEDRSYFLFGIYEQLNEWFTGDPWLRRSNLVFVPA